MVSAAAPPSWVRQCRRVGSRSETLFLYDEIHRKRAYLQHGVHLVAGSNVIDIGANIGLFTALAAQSLGAMVGVVCWAGGAGVPSLSPCCLLLHALPPTGPHRCAGPCDCRGAYAGDL